MEKYLTINGELYSEMIRRGAGNLNVHVEEVNNLNVFPIPDGDTGDNMLMTMMGGTKSIDSSLTSLSKAAKKISSGMLLGARGNSGVILSQFFDGISSGFDGLESADIENVKKAFQEGVKHAYEAVMTPTEGTILTVAKDSTNAACNVQSDDILDFINAFLDEAVKSLERTPDLLPVLKKAGVVDSGGAGLLYIVRGMRQVLMGETEESHEALPKDNSSANPHDLDLDKFTEDSDLEFGYCTEMLLRLQNKKCDAKNFDIQVIKDFLNTIGNSVVIFKTGTIVKMHVHTMTPDKVLAFCQQFGEFLTIKIENMSLQHNNLDNNEITQDEEIQEHKTNAIVAVANGDGIIQSFKDYGASYIVEGGQSMNPSSNDFIKAFDIVNADNIFVLPNNGNVILSAQQAAGMYSKSKVHVIETKTIGDGYACLTMFDPDLDSAEEIIENLNMAKEGVKTYLVSHCVRDAEMDGFTLHSGDYIGISGKQILSAAGNRKDAALKLIDSMDFTDHEACILIRGNDSMTVEFDEIVNKIKNEHPGVEVYTIEGGQDVYSYIYVLE